MITANQDTNPTPVEPNTNKLRPAAAKPMPKRKAASSRRTSAPSTGKATQKSQSASQPKSKQGRVVAMLRRTEGVTVAAVMKATNWQKHSVHGFFAGVVRKKLGLNLVSSETDGKRCYRIVGGKPANATIKSDKGAGSTSAPARNRTAA